MTESSFAAALNEQVANEYAAHQQYVAIAVHYDAETLPRLATFFYRQAVEERNHAMMIVQYLLDADHEARIPGVEAPRVDFTDLVAPVELALAQEKRVTGQINALAGRAREQGDYQGEQFMQWFIKEQTEEVSTMSEKPDSGASTPGVVTSRSASSMYCVSIIAWLRSSTAWR